MELLTPIILTFYELLFGNAKYMALIQSYNMDRRFLNGLVDHIWTNFWDSMMHIHL